MAPLPSGLAGGITNLKIGKNQWNVNRKGESALFHPLSKTAADTGTGRRQPLMRFLP
jgi:hypothetical protein